MNEGSFEFVEIGRLVNDIVKFVCCRCVLDVIDDGFQSINTECTRSQLSIKTLVYDPLNNCNASPKLVGVQDDLGN